MVIATLDARPEYVGALFALLPAGAFVSDQTKKSSYPGFLRFKVEIPPYRPVPKQYLN